MMGNDLYYVVLLIGRRYKRVPKAYQLEEASRICTEWIAKGAKSAWPVPVRCWPKENDGSLPDA